MLGLGALRALPLAVGLVACSAPRAPAPAPPPVRAVSVDAGAQPGPLTVADIAARALPSIVTIRTAESLGTGFVVRSDGWIATNMHVIVGGPRVRVTLRDEREFDVVDLLAVSAEYDLALVRVKAHGLQTVSLGDSDIVRPGDPVIAIGNPLGLEDTVSNGLVSARRTINGFEVLQVSAPIAPGSSGGPLFNERGEVVGIATAVMQGGQNLNFGVPARYLAPMIKQAAPMPFAAFAARVAQLRRASAPKIERKVPRHPISILDGCSTESQKIIVRLLGDAIEAGSTLFNDGNPDACYHLYEGAASDVVRRIPAGCKRPAKVLVDVQRRAATLTETTAQAWALRDAFDGLLDVIARKHGG
jgi:serine protease Do